MGVRKIFFIIIAMINTCACSAQTSKPVIGGVYVSNSLLKHRKISYDSVQPILALRIDNITKETLLIKYRFGIESVMDIDFEYKDSCNCYLSIGNVLFAPYGVRREKVFLKFITPKRLIFYYIDHGEKKSYEYRLTYQDKVNLSTHRNPYYAEDGFELFVK